MQVIHFVILLTVVLNYHAIICCHFVTVHSSSMAWNFSKTNQESCFCTYLFSSQKRDASHIYVKTLVIDLVSVFLFAALRMQKDLLILLRAFHARLILSHSILILDPSSNQPVMQRWLSFEMFWLKQGALFSYDLVEVMIRWLPVVSLAILVQSRLHCSVCQSNFKRHWISLCDYFLDGLGEAGSTAWIWIHEC